MLRRESSSGAVSPSRGMLEGGADSQRESGWGGYHAPVLLPEVLEGLQIEPEDTIVDLTFGGGGYGLGILERLGSEGRLIAFDRDRDAVERGRDLWKSEARLTLHHARFSQAREYLMLHTQEGHDGAVADLGVSSYQLDTPERGFSFRQDGPLDMRMDPTDETVPTAAEIVNRASESELTNIFSKLGEERRAKSVARAVVDRRATRPFLRTADLAQVVAGVVGRSRSTPNKHPATRCFQALRMAVNNELGELEQVLEDMIESAKVGARIVIVSYHSLEDGMVKHVFRDATGRCRCPRGLPVCRCGARQRVKLITRKPIIASQDEIASNRRARSARLRVVEKV